MDINNEINKIPSSMPNKRESNSKFPKIPTYRSKSIIKNKSKSIKNNEIINLLLELPYIKILPSYVITELYRSISEYHYKIHEVVLKQGDPITNLYIVKSGSFIFKINHESISSVSQDINSFIKYQKITQEPFIEKRKYELTGEIKNNEQISIFIYQKSKLFGDIEIISGMDTSLFNIISNEENSSLYVIDRIKWVKLTRRIRVMFTRLTLSKLEMIYERIMDVLQGKNNLIIDKMKLLKEKIHEQIKVNNNYDIYSTKIETKEKKLINDLDKYKLNANYNKNCEKEKSKSLRNFQQNKDYLLSLFKYPKILKEDIKSVLDKYLFKIKDKDSQRVKFRKTISNFSKDQDTSQGNLILNNDNKNAQSNLFVTNSLKLMKNYSANNILESNKTSKIYDTQKLKNVSYKIGNNSKSSFKNNIYDPSSLIDFNKKTQKIKRINYSRFSTIFEIKKSGENDNQTTNTNDELYSKKMKNWLIKTILNEENNKKSQKSKKIIMNPLGSKTKRKLKLLNTKKSKEPSSEYKKEKMNKEQRQEILKQRYQTSKEKLIQNLFDSKKPIKKENINSNNIDSIL